MSLRLAVALALAVGLGFVLGFVPALYLSGAVQAHEYLVVRTCWEQPPVARSLKPMHYRAPVSRQ